YTIIVDDHPLDEGRIKAELNGSSVKLSWDIVSGAESYTLYIAKNGKWVKAKTTNKTSLNVTKLSKDRTYKFLVRAKVNGKLTAKSEAYTISVNTANKPVISLTANKGSISVKWNKINGATAYRVYKYENGKLTFIGETSKTAVKIVGTKAGKTYTYAVKALINGKLTSVKGSDLAAVTAK
ncbi:MAG: hypothetical protein J6X60_00745, partial [Ruminiclostridium sp.]|nr:hypothetical protein [Ruminiclostridium sp.]